MKPLFAGLLSLTLLASGACSEAQSDDKGKKGGKKKGKDKGETTLLNPIKGLTKIGDMPAEVPESSGLARGPEAGTYYTHGDTRSPGGGPSLYLVRQNGELVKRIEPQGVEQRDWESLSQDSQGRLYIADCGNNGNDRRDLTIYRFDPKNPGAVSQIQFTYPDQQEFPPAKAERNFDVEASLWHGGQLYLFTRDRANSSVSKIYRLQADGPALQVAERVGQIQVPGEVTDAALSPDGRRLALLGHNQLWLAEVQGSSFSGAKVRGVELPGAGQTEGAVFIDNGHLLISSEQGALYSYDVTQ